MAKVAAERQAMVFCDLILVFCYLLLVFGLTLYIRLLWDQMLLIQILQVCPLAFCCLARRLQFLTGLFRQRISFLKVSRQERELYEEFCNSAEAEILREIRDYFIEAKQKAGVINFDRLGMWAKIQTRIDRWLGESCIWRHLNQNQVGRAREAIWHRVKDQLAKTIRETLGADGVASHPLP